MLEIILSELHKHNNIIHLKLFGTTINVLHAPAFDNVMVVKGKTLQLSGPNWMQLNYDWKNLIKCQRPTIRGQRSSQSSASSTSGCINIFQPLSKIFESINWVQGYDILDKMLQVDMSTRASTFELMKPVSPASIVQL